MTLFQLAFASGLLFTLILLALRGDYRDQWAGVVVLVQTLLVWWQIGNLVALAIIYAMALATFLAFSVRSSGVALGILSGIMSLLAIAAAVGAIPAATGQGIAFNFHHWATVVSWGQIGILGFMAHEHRDTIPRRPG